MVRVVNVADFPEFVVTIARWHWDEWGHADPSGSLRAWTAGLQSRTSRSRVPMTFVAVEGQDTPIGSVSIVEHDMPDRQDLRDLAPWIAGTFVVRAHRGQGVGGALMHHAIAEASRIGVPELFLYTSSARWFSERRGWTVLREDDFYEGEPVTIMKHRCSHDERLAQPFGQSD